MSRVGRAPVAARSVAATASLPPSLTTQVDDPPATNDGQTQVFFFFLEACAEGQGHRATTHPDAAVVGCSRLQDDLVELAQRPNLSLGFNGVSPTFRDTGSGPELPVSKKGRPSSAVSWP